jgi:hypothetical protein
MSDLLETAHYLVVVNVMEALKYPNEQHENLI